MARPLPIATYDGSGQAVHPDVIYIDDGFAGSRYWMAMTPYPNGNDRLENPSLRVSEDGLRWLLPSGVPDPVVPAPSDQSSHNADPELAYFEDRLYLTYIEVDKTRKVTRLLITSSSDARHWAEPVELRRGRLILSPSFARLGDEFLLWYVTGDATAGETRIEMLKGPAPDELSSPVACQLRIPGYVVWHIDAAATDVGFEMLVTAYPRRANNSRTVLFHAASSDGVHFQLTRARPILRPARGSWANRTVYRSTFRKTGDSYRIWYSAASWRWRWGIGMVAGPLDALTPVGDREERRTVKDAMQDVEGWVQYTYTRLGLGRRLSSVRRWRRRR